MPVFIKPLFVPPEITIYKQLAHIRNTFFLLLFFVCSNVLAYQADIENAEIMSAGKYDYDKEVLIHSLAPDPKSPKESRGVGLYEQGVARFRDGRYVGAIEDFNEAILLNPNFVEVYFLRGGTYGYEGQYDRAIEDFKEGPSLVQ